MRLGPDTSGVYFALWFWTPKTQRDTLTPRDANASVVATDTHPLDPTASHLASPVPLPPFSPRAQPPPRFDRLSWPVQQALNPSDAHHFGT